MGKKTKKEKKGKGKEKTIIKTEKKADKRAKKELAEKGEDDVERMIADFQEQDRKRTQVIEEKCAPPTPRCNMTLTPHPDKEELIMFGGEYFTGNKMFMYNDLLFYNIKKNEWLKVTAPDAPPPRSSQQAVTLKQGGGQLWIFGGEFASPSQSQFYHYKDLWVYHIKHKKWEKVSSPGGPSSRSGHRMVNLKRQLIVFGGFHDNIRDYKYYNDVYMFNLDLYTWTKVEASGVPPCPRSGCIVAQIPEQSRIIVYGGYSKERLKRDVDKGTTYVDMFVLSPEGRSKDVAAPEKWKWQPLKQSGLRPSPRCGMSAALMAGNRAVCFGGVYDEEDEEQLTGQFYNELFLLELEKARWMEISIREKKSAVDRKRRRKPKENLEEQEEDMEVTEEGLENLEIGADPQDIADPDVTSGANADPRFTLEGDRNNSAGEVTTYDDGVFKVTIGPQTSNMDCELDEAMDSNDAAVPLFTPAPRMNAQMAIMNSVLYLYGGIFEEGDKQVTLTDFYSLDLHKLEGWTTIISDDRVQVWEHSDSSDSSGDEEDESEDGACGGAADSATDSSDDDMDISFNDAPSQEMDETLDEYYSRNKEYWLHFAKSHGEAEQMELSGKEVKEFSRDLCAQCFQQNK